MHLKFVIFFCSVRLNLSAWLIKHGTMFLSHNKSINNTFQPDFSAKRNLRFVAEPPKLYGPHALIIVPKTSDDYACTPDNLRRSIGCPRRTPIQLHLTTHTRINKGVTATLQHLL
jgi:hypothetical protein